jgi:hypothetical protein
MSDWLFDVSFFSNTLYALVLGKNILWACPCLSNSRFLLHTVTTMTLDHTLAITLDAIVAFDTFVTFVITLVALLTS